MRDVYETKFGIFNHISGPEKESRPLAGIAMHSSECGLGIRSNIDMVNMFVNKDIYKLTGISMTEFLSLPHEEFNALLRAIDSKMTREATIASGIEASLNGGNTRGRH